jgi:hypothetical protein
MVKRIVFILTLIWCVALFSNQASAQCAMCKAQLEKRDNAKNTGINSGILYLMIFPYVLIGGVAYFWIKSNRKAFK